MTLKSFGQQTGQFYKIYPEYDLLYIDKTNKPNGVQKTVPPYSVVRTNRPFYRKQFYKANLIQNEKNGDTMQVLFWSIRYNDNGIPYTYVRSLDEDAFYYILSKRNNLSVPPSRYKIFKYERSEIGVATMPFKFRIGYKTDTTGKEAKVYNDVSTGINAGLYFGYKWGQTLFYNETKRTRDRWGKMVSIFTGPVAIKVSTNNVSNKIERETNELGRQIGGGVWISYGNVEAGAFLGTDIPLTGEARKWDYAYKPWIGFGLGYKLGIFDLKQN